ncbi:uncharacterized protein ASCRUDRAFT_81184 [Ascoidea rubescens DSM 1968]|uniref:Uncharacterized protein n=1 Tax=Ascoidea rubescens DSM 1968 TaxID=1344418 RepID=A0A1D2VGZ4_9ASCO|nr:hypothetical protein ASCRUDRAFT_81184 [Ascoidea rubescens DSM 1968]ODV60820.1 hypothetical protein ASCRUDRAFT_81184 [Ascoidea rubescens DSM 1968]
MIKKNDNAYKLTKLSLKKELFWQEMDYESFKIRRLDIVINLLTNIISSQYQDGEKVIKEFMRSLRIEYSRRKEEEINFEWFQNFVKEILKFLNSCSLIFKPTNNNILYTYFKTLDYHYLMEELNLSFKNEEFENSLRYKIYSVEIENSTVTIQNIFIDQLLRKELNLFNEEVLKILTDSSTKELFIDFIVKKEGSNTNNGKMTGFKNSQIYKFGLLFSSYIQICLTNSETSSINKICWILLSKLSELIIVLFDNFFVFDQYDIIILVKLILEFDVLYANEWRKNSTIFVSDETIFLYFRVRTIKNMFMIITNINSFLYLQGTKEFIEMLKKNTNYLIRLENFKNNSNKINYSNRSSNTGEHLCYKNLIFLLKKNLDFDIQIFYKQNIDLSKEELQEDLKLWQNFMFQSLGIWDTNEINNFKQLDFGIIF